MTRIRSFVLATVGAALLAAPALAADHQAQAEQLAKLRAEVEALSEQLTAEKDEAKGRLRAVEAQRVELDVQIRRQELRMDRLLAEEQSQRAAIEGAGGGDAAVRAAVERGIEALRTEVTVGLPFKTDLRLAALAELEQKMASDAITAEQAAARLWAFAEDERRLSRENVLDRQVIPLDGQDVLVDVARVGMVAMYWRAPDGRIGRVRGVAGGWEYPTLSGADEEAVAALFDALGKGIRSGAFSLPALTAEVH
jgi:hypothetical protein